MRDPNRMVRVLRRVEELWKQYPDWRLGQLLLNAADWADDELWNLEDERLVEILEEHLSRQVTKAETP